MGATLFGGRAQGALAARRFLSSPVHYLRTAATQSFSSDSGQLPEQAGVVIKKITLPPSFALQNATQCESLSLDPAPVRLTISCMTTSLLAPCARPY